MTARSAPVGLMESPGLAQCRPMPLRHDRSKWRPRRRPEVQLSLTSLVDVMVILTLFLTLDYTPAAELLCTCIEPDRPRAANVKELERAEVVKITRNIVTLAGRPVAEVADLLRADQRHLSIADLHDQLVTLKNNHRLLHPSEAFPGVVLVDADRSVSYAVLKTVLRTCARAGYANVHLTVNRGVPW